MFKFRLQLNIWNNFNACKLFLIKILVKLEILRREKIEQEINTFSE